MDGFFRDPMDLNGDGRITDAEFIEYMDMEDYTLKRGIYADSSEEDEDDDDILDEHDDDLDDDFDEDDFDGDDF